MSYDVLEVCRHVINYSNEQDYGISNLKLQKVLYLIQAYFLIDKTKNALLELKKSFKEFAGYEYQGDLISLIQRKNFNNEIVIEINNQQIVQFLPGVMILMLLNVYWNME